LNEFKQHRTGLLQSGYTLSGRRAALARAAQAA
jgi:hypothetical protein